MTDKVPTTTTTTSEEPQREAVSVQPDQVPGWLAVARVFGTWSLRSEATRWKLMLLMLLPLLVGGLMAATSWPTWHAWRRPITGTTAMTQLVWVALLAVGFGGVQYASKAVCWELSRELRDIVRLTSLHAQTLLWTNTLTRWTTIGWSLLLLLPLACLAFTFGNVVPDQLIAAAYGLLLGTALVGSMAMLAGVLTCNAENPEKMATNVSGTMLVIYNLAFGAVSHAIYWGWYFVTGDTAPVELLCSRITLCSPAVSATLAMNSPSLFSPLDVGYWIHFVAAALIAGLASLGMHFKWQGDVTGERLTEQEVLQRRGTAKRRGGLAMFGPSVSRAGRADEPRDISLDDKPLSLEKTHSQQTEQPADRPFGRCRCSDRPFLWKDIYILSDERKWMNTWSLFYVVATAGIVAFYGTIGGFVEATLFMGILSIVVVSLVVSVRFDALLTPEFRDRTWGSLMLLPVDPCRLLFAKLQAALWEQRVAALPLLVTQLALILAMPTGAYADAMAAVIAPLVGCLLCQMACINQLLGKKWWVGPIQAIAFVTVLTASIALFSLGDTTAAFTLTTSLLLGTTVGVHLAFVQPLARNWCEP